MTEVSDIKEFVGTGAAVIDFYRTQCAPCKALEPVLTSVAAEFPEVKFGKVNLDENPAYAVLYRIRGTPTLLYFRGGQVAGMTVGSINKTKLAAKVQELVGS